PHHRCRRARARQVGGCLRHTGGSDGAPDPGAWGPAAVIVGQDRAVEGFASAWATRKLHHAWLLAGPKGVGKASFAHAAARRVLAEAAGPRFDLPRIETEDDHPIVKLVEAGSHPDMRWLERIENPKAKTPGTLYKNIIVEQI